MEYMTDPQSLKILIVEDEEEIRELVIILLGAQIEAEFIEAKSGNDAVSILEKQGSTISLVICDFNMPQGNGGVVFNYIQQHLPRIPYILMTSDTKGEHNELTSGPLCGYIQKPFFDDSILVEIKRLIEKAKGSIRPTSDYIGISVKTLRSIEKISCPIYIKLGDGHYVKVSNGEFTFNNEELEKYKKKSVVHLYVESKDFNNLTHHFVKHVLSEMFLSALSERNLRTVDLSQSVQEVVSHAVKTLNWSADIQDLAMKNIALVQAAVESIPNLCEKYDWFENEDHEYGVLHSVLLAYTLTWICKGIEFKSKHALENLTLAAFFHDASLEDFLIKNESRYSNAIHLKSAVNKEEIDITRSHPERSIALLSSWKNAPEDMLTIMRQHHETPDGTGFPKGIKGNEISELTGAFIVAHEIVEVFIKSKDRSKVKNEMKAKESLFNVVPTQKFYLAAMAVL